jgi:hypothetical protein
MFANYMLLVIKLPKLRAVVFRNAFRPKFNTHASKAYDGEEAHRFLQAHLLHWLEALGWMGKTSEGIQTILSLEAHIPVSYLSYLSIIYKSLTCP